MMLRKLKKELKMKGREGGVKRRRARIEREVRKRKEERGRERGGMGGKKVWKMGNAPKMGMRTMVVMQERGHKKRMGQVGRRERNLSRKMQRVTQGRMEEMAKEKVVMRLRRMLR